MAFPYNDEMCEDCGCQFGDCICNSFSNLTEEEQEFLNNQPQDIDKALEEAERIRDRQEQIRDRYFDAEYEFRLESGLIRENR
jgi:hypothetical protein